jgi:hypothetical protein
VQARLAQSPCSQSLTCWQESSRKAGRWNGASTTAVGFKCGSPVRGTAGQRRATACSACVRLPGLWVHHSAHTTCRLTGGQAGKQAHMPTGRQSGRQAGRERGRQVGVLAGRQAGRQAGIRQVIRQRHVLLQAAPQVHALQPLL